MSDRVPIEQSKLKADLEKIGITKGDHVSVALSFKSIGFVKDGPNMLIDALLDVVGPMGTIMMNTHTEYFPISEINPNYIFDPESTPPLTGLVPATLIKRKAAIRSKHPTCSVAAVGRLAENLTVNHDECSSPYLPLERLAKIGGKLLCIGIDGRLVALRHEAQRRAGLFAVPILSGVRYKRSGGDIGLFVWVAPPCASRLPELVPRLERMGIIKRSTIGQAPSLVGPINKLLDSMSAMLKEDPTLNLCYDFSCLSCRELERRMNLYERIRNPKFFQRSLLIRQLLHQRNRIALRRYSYVSFNSSQRKRKIHPAGALKAANNRFYWLVSKILK